MQFEQTRSDFLRVAARELKKLHAIAKSIPQYRPANISVYRWDSMQSIKDAVRARRSEMKSMSLQDPLFLREQEYKKLGNNRMVDYEYYQDINTGQITHYANVEPNWQGNYKRFNMLPFGISEGYRIEGEDTIYFNPVIHWKDDFLEKIRNGDYRGIHDRINHFRIDGKFYDWDHYFKYDNQAWNKANWDLNNGKLVDLNKSIKIYCNLGNISGYSNKIITEYMNAPQGDHFVNALQEMNEKKEKAFIGIRLYFGDFPVNLMGKNFLYTLFKNENSRYCISQENQDYLSLSKRQLENCDLVSSQEHRDMIETMIFNYIEEVHSPDSDTERRKELAKKTFMSEVRFRVFFVDSEIASSKGIKEQIWKEVFSEGKNYNPTELKQRLAIARALLKEEKNYAGHDR